MAAKRINNFFIYFSTRSGNVFTVCCICNRKELNHDYIVLMKRMLSILSCAIIFFSCHKESVSTPPVENIGQKLVKITNTLVLSENMLSTDSINFDYDDAGKIIAEGKMHYYRDAKERITRITQPLWGVDDFSSYVFYADSLSGKVSHVAYGSSRLGYEDSVSYLHDSQGRVSKMMDYYFFDDRDSFVLIAYYLLDYDEKSNLREITRYALDRDRFIPCSLSQYGDYDTKVNPLCSDDEVRLLENFWGLGNVSANNVRFTEHNNFHEQYEYRDDGKPSSCSITQNGKEIYRAGYFYK